MGDMSRSLKKRSYTLETTSVYETDPDCQTDRGLDVQKHSIPGYSRWSKAATLGYGSVYRPVPEKAL